MGVISLTTIDALFYFMDQQELQLLKEAVNEIKSLRSQNQLMAARLGVFDDMMMLIRTSPVYPGYSLASPDVVYNMEKQIVKSESEIKETDPAKAKQWP